jgi:hypothetical protein
MTQWMHIDYHFDTDGKIDEAIHYMDKAAVMAAMPKK